MEGLYRLSKVAEEAEVTRSTVQYYKEIGLINSYARSNGGYHLFTYAAIEKVRLIRKLRENGKSIEEIKKYFKEMKFI